MSTDMEPVCPPPRRLKQFEGVSMDESCFHIVSGQANNIENVKKQLSK